jgi:hypothetical protein
MLPGQQFDHSSGVGFSSLIGEAGRDWLVSEFRDTLGRSRQAMERVSQISVGKSGIGSENFIPQRLQHLLQANSARGFEENRIPWAQLALEPNASLER